MFTLNEAGTLETDSATYRALLGLPRVAGSPEAGPLVANTGRVSASAVKAKRLPIFVPDPVVP